MEFRPKRNSKLYLYLDRGQQCCTQWSVAVKQFWSMNCMWTLLSCIGCVVKLLLLNSDPWLTLFRRGLPANIFRRMGLIVVIIYFTIDPIYFRVLCVSIYQFNNTLKHSRSILNSVLRVGDFLRGLFLANVRNKWLLGKKCQIPVTNMTVWHVM